MSQQVTIYHNPQCSKSQAVLTRLEEKGLSLRVVNYLEEPLSAADLRELQSQLDCPLRAVLRTDHLVYAERDLGNPSLSDEEVLQALLAHPTLLNRPIVVTEKGAKLCRPIELVDSLL